MDTYNQKFTSLQNRIIRFLCIRAGSKVNQSVIAKYLEVSPTAVSKAIILLEEMNILKKEKSKTMNLNLIELNRDSYDVISMKRVKNLEIINDYKLVDFLEEKFPGSTIILFGSFSRGDDTINSDIDIAIINSKEKKIDLDNFEKNIEREIRLQFYESFQKINKELKENLFNGIVLAGGIEL
jgi:predicted nucleotidyltransferase